MRRAAGNPSVERRLTTVKADAETHRLIGDLAHLLGRTRKDLVRDAVNAFAAWREAVLDHGAEASSERLALANARHTARLASGELMTSAPERSQRSRVGASRISEAAFLRLIAHERLELRARNSSARSPTSAPGIPGSSIRETTTVTRPRP